MDLITAELVIEAEGISRPDMRALVTEHFEELVAMAAPESSHALELDAFANPDLTLFGVRRQGQLLGCGALKELDAAAGELKTMRVVAEVRGAGVGGAILDYLVAEAAQRGYQVVYLETGSEPFFEPAHALYHSRGFVECGPFADYLLDPHSVFMRREL